MQLDTIGKNIRKYRLMKKFRQEDLAEKAGLTTNYIGMVERGEKIPSLETFIKILNALEVSSDMVLTDVLETGYTDYLSIQQTLSELTEDAMILVDQTHEKSYYTIAEIGKETLRFFGNQLPTDTCRQIDEYLEKNRLAIVETTSIKTDYTMIRPNEYLATGCIYERGSKLLEVSLNVTSEEEAVDVCRRFKEKNEDVYAQILSLLCMD